MLRYVDVDHVVEWLLGDPAFQMLVGPPGKPHDPPLTEVTRLEMLADDFKEAIASTEIPTITVPTREQWRCPKGHINAPTEATCYLCGDEARRP